MPLAREQRRLAAILFADAVGSSRLMGRDESGTLARLRKNRSEHLDPVLANPNDTFVLRLLGTLEAAVGQYEQALEHGQQVLRLNPASRATIWPTT
jgi:Flp pilus assembly protein TadD